MIVPQRAPVRPRIVSQESGEAFPLEDEVRRLLDSGARGVVAVLGEPGAGKTAALAHLAAVLPAEERIVLVDESDLPGPEARPPVCIVVYAAQWSQDPRAHAGYWLAPWGTDECIEFLLANHRDRCASVMARLLPMDRTLCRGLPELWRAVLEQFARDETIRDIPAALRAAAAEWLTDADYRARVCRACLAVLVSPQPVGNQPETADPRAHLFELVSASAGPPTDGAPCGVGLRGLVRHRPVQILVAADLIIHRLREASGRAYLDLRLPRDIVTAVAAAIAGEPVCQERLVQLLAGAADAHAMAASILHAARIRWAPAGGKPPLLYGAFLDRVIWPEVCLASANLADADFTGADLQDADLRGALAYSTSLALATLKDANLEKLHAEEANLNQADLTRAWAHHAWFDGANLSGAKLESAELRHASFIGAKLSGAVFRDAELEGAVLINAEMSGANFSNAFLEGARLSGLCLRDATWTNASFGAAMLDGCDLEGLELPGVCFEDANLRGALLTGCRMRGANFDYACLTHAGLADIDLEGATLREADLRGASFHLGSSRSGLVGSPIACEGSRTGFYTDDYEEQTYKSPEEIRKANLCGADLRGALVDGVDFYLVDLRGALYDRKQEAHFRRCGAILHDPVED
jgi:uncharacterized protein YjbI with pentapeptide repeats